MTHAAKECCLNCRFGKAVTGHVERQCNCPQGPQEGRLMSPRSWCRKYERWRPGVHTTGARRWCGLGPPSGQRDMED